MHACMHTRTHTHIHTQILHFVFLPRIQEELNEFIGAWNNHWLSTIKISPVQAMESKEHSGPHSDDDIAQIKGRHFGDAKWGPRAQGWYESKTCRRPRQRNPHPSCSHQPPCTSPGP
jgi:hypothetical protein